MQKLHLVGFTTDHEGLILSARRGSRSGGYLLAVDAAVEEAVEALRAQRGEEPDDVDESTSASRTPRVESTLPVREIQARLRQGRSVADVAKAAGVDVAWVERFAPPILAERAQMISRVQSVPLRRARLGPSALPIGEAVRRHLADRSVMVSPDEFASAWTARQLASGRWVVRFTFHYRGRNNVLRFDLDESSGEVTAADRQSGQLGYVTPTGSAAKPRRQPTRSAPVRRPVSRPVVSTGFRADPAPAKAVSRSAKERERAAAAMRKVAAQGAVDAERAATRRARERAAEAARKEREDKATAARAARDERAKATAARVKAAAAKKRTAERARAKEVAAKERLAAAAAKKTAARKAPAKKTAARKAPAKKAPAKKTAARKAPAKKTAARKAPAKKTAARKAPARKAPARKAPAKKAVLANPVAARPAAPAVAPPRPPTSTTPAAATPIRRERPPAPASATDRLPAIRPTDAPVSRTGPSFSIIPRPATVDRPSFRQGSVESAHDGRGGSDGRDGGAPRPVAAASDRSTNGPEPVSAPGVSSDPPRPDRPRRTRPLRAT